MGLDPAYLADRQLNLNRFERCLAGFPTLPRNVRLTGLRGVGNTGLLQHYARIAEEHGWAVVGREWSEHLQDQRTFALALVDDCRQAAEQAWPGGGAPSGRRSTRLPTCSITVSLAGLTVSVKPADRDRRSAPTEDQCFAALRSCSAGITTARRRGLIVLYDHAHVVRDSGRSDNYSLGTLLTAVARAKREAVLVMLVLLTTVTAYVGDVNRPRCRTETVFCDSCRHL